VRITEMKKERIKTCKKDLRGKMISLVLQNKFDFWIKKLSGSKYTYLFYAKTQSCKGLSSDILIFKSPLILSFLTFDFLLLTNKRNPLHVAESSCLKPVATEGGYNAPEYREMGKRGFRNMGK
jgi:hypothetical protein